jgi:hypothetical protein
VPAAFAPQMQKFNLSAAPQADPNTFFDPNRLIASLIASRRRRLNVSNSYRRCAFDV